MDGWLIALIVIAVVLLGTGIVLAIYFGTKDSSIPTERTETREEIILKNPAETATGKMCIPVNQESLINIDENVISKITNAFQIPLNCVLNDMETLDTQCSNFGTKKIIDGQVEDFSVFVTNEVSNEFLKNIVNEIVDYLEKDCVVYIISTSQTIGSITFKIYSFILHDTQKLLETVMGQSIPEGFNILYGGKQSTIDTLLNKC